MALGSISTSGLNFSGLSTGIDASKIIDGLTALTQKRIDRLTTQQGEVEKQQAAFTGLQTRLAEIQLQAGRLSRTVGGAFDARKVTPSDTEAISATAGSASTPGTYNLTVNTLARANQVSSEGFADLNSQIKEGTLTLRVGSGETKTVTINSQNNTLQGLADAINNSGADVRAAIINDGSSTPYRLLLTSTKLGASNSINVTNNLTTGSGASIDPLNRTIQTGLNASVTLGSGTGAITVSSESNQLSSLIPGVSINLLKADPAKPLTLNVSNDSESGTKAIKDLIESYNNLIDFIAERNGFDAKTQQAGLLLGNREVAAIQNDLASVFTSSVAGARSDFNRLSAVGISLGEKGKLSLDEAKLSQVFSGQSGASIPDLKRLFGLTGTSSDPGVQFVFGSGKTQPTPLGSPYRIEVTTPASRASATATSALASSITINGSNNSFSIRVNGIASSTITLTEGTYTQASLAEQVQQQINANASLNGNTVAVGVNGSGKLQFTSQAFGSTSKISFAGGSALATLGLSGTETSTGVDVAGQIRVGTRVEQATGSGQILTSKPGNTSTDGLQVRVTSSTTITADLTITQGLAGKLSAVLDKYLSPTGGRLKTANDGFNKSIDELKTSISKQNSLIEEKRTELTLRFAQMEAAVSRIKNLGGQLVSLIPKSSF